VLREKKADDAPSVPSGLDIEDLREALQRGQLRLEYQPIVALPTRVLTGLEALLRWDHPDRGLIAPGQFLPFAEDTGLIQEIGRWVLFEACRQMREWRDAWPGAQSLYMAVNVSHRQLVDSDLAEVVCGALGAAGWPPESLKIEVTESSVMPDPDLAVAVLESLRGLGVTVAIDDFGNAYSSLDRLQFLPFDTLKVDRTVVARLDRTEPHAEIVKTVVGLASRLGLTTVAEGIETPEQLAELRELGCSHGQGFLFARPADPAAVGKWIGGPARAQAEPRSSVSQTPQSR